MSKDDARQVITVPLAPILTDTDVRQRMLLLAELQSAFDALCVRAVRARNHRLVLRYNTSPLAPSGLTDPALHVFAPCGMCAVTTDGISYRSASGGEWPVADPGAAAAIIAGTEIAEHEAGQPGLVNDPPGGLTA
jgi:hypothetical protein